MPLTVETKKDIIQEYKQSDNDTGSPEVQVALLTNRINQITEHLKKFKKDHAARRSLVILVGQRRRLLRYVHGKSVDRYKKLIASLGIRGKI